MKKFKKGFLSKHFKVAVALTAVMSLPGCVSMQWSGESGHGEDRIEEPLLDYEPIMRDAVRFEDIGRTVTRARFTRLDNMLHSGDDFSVQRVTFPGYDGTDQQAYLTIPEGEGPHPLVIVFPVLRDDGSVSEVVSKSLARRGYAVLRMRGYRLNLDQEQTVQDLMDKFRHTITDARALMQHIKDMPEIDEERIAVAGVSLGSLLSAVMMGVDEEIDAGAFILSGGGLSEILYDSEEETVEAFRNYLVSAGIVTATGGSALLGGGIVLEGMSEMLEEVEHDSLVDFRDQFMRKYNIETREDFIRLTRPYTLPLDPSRYAGSLDPCTTMIVSGRGDQVIPIERTEELWERLGRPDWHKVPGGHTPILSFYWIMDKVADHMDRVLFGERCDAEPANDNDDTRHGEAPQRDKPAAILPKRKLEP